MGYDVSGACGLLPHDVKAVYYPMCRKAPFFRAWRMCAPSMGASRELATASKRKCNCVRATGRGKDARNDPVSR